MVPLWTGGRLTSAPDLTKSLVSEALMTESVPSPSAVHVVTLTRALGLRLAVYGTALFFVALVIALGFSPTNQFHVESTVSLLTFAGVFLGTVVTTIVLHEAVHGVFMWAYGGAPRFGVGCIGWVLPYAYAVSPGVPFTLRQMAIICLAPLVLLSGAALAVLWLVPAAFTPAAVAFVTNVSGSIGDIWIAGLIWRFRHCRDVTFVDSRDSMTIHTDDPQGVVIAAGIDSLEFGGVIRRLIVRSTVAVSLMLFAAGPLGIALSVLNAPDVTIGPSRLPLVEYRTMGGQGLSIELNLPGIVAGGLLAAALSLPFSMRRRSRDTSAGAKTAPPRPAFL